MGFSKMLGLLQIKSKGSIVLVNAGSFYIARIKDVLSFESEKEMNILKLEQIIIQS